MIVLVDVDGCLAGAEQSFSKLSQGRVHLESKRKVLLLFSAQKKSPQELCNFAVIKQH